MEDGEIVVIRPSGPEFSDLQGEPIEKTPTRIIGPDYHQFSIARGRPIEISGPITTITDRPGLGVDVDWDVVRANRPA